MSTNNNMTKDPMIVFKSVKRTTDENGKLRVSLSMSKEETAKLIEVLQALASSERGTKLDVHVRERETNDGSRRFDSAFAFVKEIQEFGANAGGGQKKTFPATPTKGYTDASQVAAAKAKISKTLG